MIREKIEALREDHPYVAWVVETAYGVAKNGSERMSGVMGKSVNLTRKGLGKAHDQIRRWRGGDPEAERGE